jgi:hypothetical protein
LSPLLGFLAFPVLVSAGLWYRHRPDIHKRLMLFAVLGLHGVPLTHLSGYLLGYWPAQAGLFSLIGRAMGILLLLPARCMTRCHRVAFILCRYGFPF